MNLSMNFAGCTLAWLSQHRRQSQDYEEHVTNREAMLYIAMIRVMARRLAEVHLLKPALRQLALKLDTDTLSWLIVPVAP
jgi:hypothetical protein